jgi:hypothetical protein
MRKLILIVTCFITFISQGCNQTAKQQDSSVYNARVFKTEKADFGYDIYKDSTLVIHQPIIPSVSGNAGFVNEEEAKKVAALMIDKLNKGVMPPSVTVEEMEKLNITFH